MYFETQDKLCDMRHSRVVGLHYNYQNTNNTYLIKRRAATRIAIDCKV